MLTKYAYWIFRGALSEKDREEIKRIGVESNYGDGKIATDTSLSENEKLSLEKGDANIRDSGVSFSNDPYLYKTLTPFTHSANEKAGWKYDIDWFENIQVTRYRKNQHYAWHTDGASDHFSPQPSEGGNFVGRVRKISLVASLSDGYVGGELELALQRQDEPNEILYPEMECGDVIVFPSYMYHRSTPVTKGIKYSSVMWALGPPFK